MINQQVLAEAAAADSAALTAAAVSAEEALACHRDALAALAAGWRSQTGSVATDSLQQQCAHATDVVAELHRAAAELALLRDRWTESVNAAAALSGAERIGDPPPADAAGPQPVSPQAAHSGATPPPVADPAAAPPFRPATDPGVAQAAATPWSVPPAAIPPTPPAWQPGGSIPALPDFGGALVGLVAEVAQALGSYSGSSASPGVVTAAKAASTEQEPHPPHRKPRPVNKPAAVPGLPSGAVPKTAAAQPQTIVPTPTAPPSELLAAERPPDPVPPPPPIVAAPAPEPPPAPAEPPPASVAPVVPTPPSTDANTPCEIAADELPKVGE